MEISNFYDTLVRGQALASASFLQVCNMGSVIVFVCVGCRNKKPSAGQLVNNTHLFLTVLEAGRPRSRCRLSGVWGDQIPGSSSHGGRGWGALWGFVL